MKTLIFILLTSISITICFGQDAKKVNLDGKTYVMESYIGKEKQPDDIMKFMEGKLESSECAKWGFPATEYLYKGGGFVCKMISEKEGVMTWNGKIDGSNISGTILWVKDGQDDITMNFKGKEK